MNEEGEQELYASGLPAELGTDDDGNLFGTDEPKVGLGTNVLLLLWTFSSTDASVQVCTLPCSSYQIRVVDMHRWSTRWYGPVPYVPLTK